MITKDRSASVVKWLTLPLYYVPQIKLKQSII